MPALICGSLAFDTITLFPGRFAQQILPEQLHILNVSFLVPTLRREFGGCAGNIAYTLQALGGEPVVMAALGADGDGYLERLRGWGVPCELVRREADGYTAQAIIITDTDNNQITAFHPGAMQSAHLTEVPKDDPRLKLAIVAPDGRDAMLQHAAQLADAGIPFVFDPGQGLPMFDGDELEALRRAGQLGGAQRLRGEDAVRPHRPHARSAVRPAERPRRHRHARRARLRRLAARRAHARAGRRGHARSSTRPAAATPSAPRCSTAWSATGRSSAAWRSATRSAR